MHYFLQSMSHFPLPFYHIPYRAHSASVCLGCPYPLQLPKFSTPAKLMLCHIRLSNHSPLLVILSSEYTFSTSFQTTLLELSLYLYLDINIDINRERSFSFHSPSFGNQKAEVVFTLLCMPSRMPYIHPFIATCF